MKKSRIPVPFAAKAAALIFPLLVVIMATACSKQDIPAAMPEVNDANCHINALKAMPDEALRKKFAGLCLRRGSLTKGPDKGLKAW